MSDLLEAWDAELAVLEANRDERDCPKDWNVERTQLKKLEALYAQLQQQYPEATQFLRRPIKPRGVPPEERNLVFHNARGELIGYEDYD